MASYTLPVPVVSRDGNQRLTHRHIGPALSSAGCQTAQTNPQGQRPRGGWRQVVHAPCCEQVPLAHLSCTHVPKTPPCCARSMSLQTARTAASARLITHQYNHIPCWWRQLTRQGSRGAGHSLFEALEHVDLAVGLGGLDKLDCTCIPRVLSSWSGQCMNRMHYHQIHQRTYLPRPFSCARCNADAAASTALCNISQYVHISAYTRPLGALLEQSGQLFRARQVIESASGPRA